MLYVYHSMLHDNYVQCLVIRFISLDSLCISHRKSCLFARPPVFIVKVLPINKLTFSRPHVRPHVRPHLTPHVRPHVEA